MARDKSVRDGPLGFVASRRISVTKNDQSMIFEVRVFRGDMAIPPEIVTRKLYRLARSWRL